MKKLAYTVNSCSFAIKFMLTFTVSIKPKLRIKYVTITGGAEIIARVRSWWSSSCTHFTECWCEVFRLFFLPSGVRTHLGLDTAVKGNQLFPSNLQNHFSTGNNINRVTSFRTFSCRRAAAQAVNYNMFPGWEAEQAAAFLCSIKTSLAKLGWWDNGDTLCNSFYSQQQGLWQILLSLCVNCIPGVCLRAITNGYILSSYIELLNSIFLKTYKLMHHLLMQNSNISTVKLWFSTGER